MSSSSAHIEGSGLAATRRGFVDDMQVSFPVAGAHRRRPAAGPRRPSFRGEKSENRFFKDSSSRTRFFKDSLRKLNALGRPPP
jgi:hypothetical protein